MSIGVFLLLICICLGILYIVHKYFGKEQFYLLGIVYTILSFIMSFKIVNILGIDINMSVIFGSGVLVILYYFVSRYSDVESRKFVYTMIISILTCIFALLLAVFVVPSIYDSYVYYQGLVLENLAIVVLYPISFAVTLFLSEYCFRELEKEKRKKIFKTITTVAGIIFIDTAIFIYFSYAFIIRFDVAIRILVDNYLMKVIIMSLYVLIVNKLFMVRKVK